MPNNKYLLLTYIVVIVPLCLSACTTPEDVDENVEPQHGSIENITITINGKPMEGLQNINDIKWYNEKIRVCW